MYVIIKISNYLSTIIVSLYKYFEKKTKLIF